MRFKSYADAWEKWSEAADLEQFQVAERCKDTVSQILKDRSDRGDALFILVGLALSIMTVAEDTGKQVVEIVREED